MMNTVSTEAGRQAMKALKRLELSKNTEAVDNSRKKRERQIRMLEHAKREMWALWHKTNSQIGRDCILTGIVEASREIGKLENEKI